MNILKKSVFFTAISIIFLACEKKSETKTADIDSLDSTKYQEQVLDIERKSANSVEELNTILLTALKNKDKNSYLAYCFTQAQEEKASSLLTDEKKQKYFRREFGFSLHEEVAYFENIVKYIEKSGIDLSKIDSTLIESFDYNRSNYAPVVLKEVVIPIIQEGIERDIVYVAVQIENRWYFTSELSL